MKIFNLDITTVKNFDKKQNIREQIIQGIVEEQLYKESESIKKWRDAIEAAENAILPNNYDLQRIYNEAMLDTHVGAVIGTRINKILSSEWSINNADGTKNEEITKLIDKKWFRDVRKYINEANYYGASLIQLGPIKNDEFETVNIVPRVNVIAKYKSIRKTFGMYAKEDLISFNEKPYIYWCVFADSGSLGLLSQVASHAIWKKNTLGFWARYTELFGMPVRIGRTDIYDTTKRTNMSNMLKNMTSGAWGTFDKNDLIEFVQSSVSDGSPVFEKMINLNNAEISKIILGQTMTTDNGSSRSQAEVHERVLDIYLQADKRFEIAIINKELFPILEFHRLIPQGLNFSHVENESLEIKLKKIKAVVDMQNAGFIINKEFAQTYTGITIDSVTVKQSTKENPPTPNDMIKLVNKYYNIKQ